MSPKSYQAVVIIPQGQLCYVVVNNYTYIFSGDFIYALGGFAAVRLNSVEQYDVRENTWTRIESMLKWRCHATAVVLNNQIFICGGE